MNSILNVTALSLATNAGLIDAPSEEVTEAIRNRLVKAQLGILQRKPQSVQTPIYNEFAAIHLPALFEKYQNNTGPLNSSMTLLNVITTTPYFMRFARTSTAEGLVALQMKRTVEAAYSIINMTADEVGEIGQFLSTLLLIQGTATIDEDHKKILIPKLKEWERAFSGRLASETSTRCLALLTDDAMMRPMMHAVRQKLESSLTRCGSPICDRTTQDGGADLLRCARCRTAVYCGVEHQKNAWSSHKSLCFTPSF